jgi:low temperature requirement protein LtrA
MSGQGDETTSLQTSSYGTPGLGDTMSSHGRRAKASGSRPSRPVLYVRDGERHATWLELFFDLVFVLAVAQLARYLHDHLTGAGAVGFLFLFVPVWSAWMGFSYFADLFDIDSAEYQVTMVGAMLLSVAVAVNIHSALGGGAAGFAAAYAGLRLVLIGLYAWAWRNVPSARRLCRWQVLGFSLGVLVWLTSVFVPPPIVYAFWVVALAIEVTTPFLAQLSVMDDPPLQTSHLPERLGLFTLVVLGESVVVTGTALNGTNWNATSTLCAALGFIIVAGLWWLYFERVDEEALERAYTGGVRALVRGYAWAYGHLFIFAGLAATAVGIEVAITAATGPTPTALDGHAAEPTGAGAGAAVLGLGVAVSLLTMTWVQSLAPPPVARMVLLARLGLSALALVVAAVGAGLAPLVQIGLIAFGVGAVVAWSGWRARQIEGVADSACGTHPESDLPQVAARPDPAGTT